MRCEYCNNVQDGSYGSGRFCSERCARGYSTRDKRAGISKKVSDSLKEKQPVGGIPFKSGFDSRRECSLKAAAARWKKEREARELRIKYSSWDDLLNLTEKKARVKLEQNNKCADCKLEEWKGFKITLEYHHEDGKKDNNSRENVRYLCPNCHSLTKTWRNKDRWYLNSEA